MINDWNALKLFVAITRNGSLTGAAKQLGVNHSTVFRRLNSFESDMGGRLFERLASGYVLTPLGEELFDKAKYIIDQFEVLEHQLVGKDVQPSGVVKITAPNNIASRFLPRYIAEFNLKYPKIVIEILADNFESNMNTRHADIAVSTIPSPPEHLVGRKIKKIQWSVFGSEAYRSRRGYPLSTNDLSEHEFVGAVGNIRNLPAFVWMEQHHAQRIGIRCDELVTMSYCAEVGQGLAILPNDLQRQGLDKLFAFDAVASSLLWVLTHPDLRNTEKIRLVMQHLTAAFQDDPLL